MPLSALLLLLAAAPEPATAPHEQPAIAPEGFARATSIEAGPSRGSLYALRLSGGGVHISYGNDDTVRAERGWALGWALGGGVGRSSTPAGLAVTDVAIDVSLHARWRPVRLGAGAEVRFLDVERRTNTVGTLGELRIDPIAFLSVDVFRMERVTMFVAARGYGLATLAWTGQAMAGVRF